MTAVGSDAFRELVPGMYWMQELGPGRRHMVVADGEAPAWCPTSRPSSSRRHGSRASTRFRSLTND